MNSYDYMTTGMGWTGMGRSTHRGMGQPCDPNTDPNCGGISTDLTAWGINIGGPSSTDTSTGASGTNLCSLYPAMCTGSGTPLTSYSTPPPSTPNKPSPTSSSTVWLIGGAFLFVLLASRR